MSTEGTPIREPVHDQLWILTNLTARPFSWYFGKRFRINLTEWRILRIVARNPGVTAQDVTDYSGLDKMSVSRAVRALESGGLLERQGGAGGRSLPLHVTDQGQTTFQEILEMARRRDQQIFGELSPAESVAFEAILGKLLVRARSVMNAQDL